MNLPILNKFYSVNIFIYFVVIKAICAFVFYLPFWNSEFLYEHFVYFFWLPSLIGIILILSEIIVNIAMFLIPVEFILYKLKKITRNSINMSIKSQVLIWFLVTLSFIYSYWFQTYYYPIIEQQLIMD